MKSDTTGTDVDYPAQTMMMRTRRPPPGAFSMPGESTSSSAFSAAVRPASSCNACCRLRLPGCLKPLRRRESRRDERSDRESERGSEGDSLEGRRHTTRAMEESCREEEHQPALPDPASHDLSPPLVEDGAHVGQVTPSKAAAAAPESGVITSQMPENVIGSTLVVRGRVEFQNLLRIDGYFEGELVGDGGSLIIGPTAEVISDIRGLQEVYVEGILIGDCSCEKMQIRIAGCVMGNLQCASLGMDPSVVLKGSANVNPHGAGDKEKRKSRARSRQNRQKLQSRLSSDENSSRASFSSTAGFSPYSAAARTPRFGGERHSALRDDDTPKQGTRPGTHKEGGGAKGGRKSNAGGKVKRRNSMGAANVYGNDAQGGRAVPSSHRRVYSNENLPPTANPRAYAPSMEENTYKPGSDGVGDTQGNEALLF